MFDSYICIDTGNSGTKIVYSFPETDKIHSLFMSSALDEVSRERMENKLNQSNWLSFPKPEQQAWLGNGGSKVIAVGELAEKFSPLDRRQEPKYENALYKILAAIGVIIETHQISRRKKFKVQLGLLLPWNEYKDRERLLNRLEKLSSEYEFRGQKVRVKIKKPDCICYPEGGGIAMARVREKGLDWFKQQRLGVLMLGDRNWSGLCFDSGQIKSGASPLDGFSFLLDRVIENSPCLLNREKLSEAIFKGIAQAKKNQERYPRPQWQELEPIQSLATARDSDLRESEVKDIDRAMTMVAKDWEVKLLNLIQQVFPKPLTELNVGGGSLPFFAPLIEEHFNWAIEGENQGYSPINISKDYVPVLVSAGITNEVTEALELTSITAVESAFALRFADVFSLIKFLRVEGGTK